MLPLGPGRRPGCLASFGSGAGTSVIGSFENGAEDLREAVLRERRGEVVNQVSACSGTTRETPSSTLELRTSLPSVGSAVPARAEPISQATSSIATTLTSAPPVASSGTRRRPGDVLPQVVAEMRGERLADGGTDDDDDDGATTPNVPGAASSVSPFQTTGSTKTATSPPPRKPITDRMPTTKPCR